MIVLSMGERFRQAPRALAVPRQTRSWYTSQVTRRARMKHSVSRKNETQDLTYVVK
jgi:hypothetical protein